MKKHDEFGPLIDEYEQWNKAQGLNLGSADEHLHDPALTDEQRAWLADFSRRWDEFAESDIYDDNQWDLACPKCGADYDYVAVEIKVWIRLCSNGSEVKDGDHEWDESSRAYCEKCGHFGIVSDFEVPAK